MVTWAWTGPFEQAGRLLLVGVPKFPVGDLPQGGELGARADRSGNPAGPVGGAELERHLFGDPGGGHVQLVHPVF